MSTKHCVFIAMTVSDFAKLPSHFERFATRSQCHVCGSPIVYSTEAFENAIDQAKAIDHQTRAYCLGCAEKDLAECKAVAVLEVHAPDTIKELRRESIERN